MHIVDGGPVIRKEDRLRILWLFVMECQLYFSLLVYSPKTVFLTM